MVVGWLFPHRERCGIAIYSRNYCAALNNHCQIISVNSDHLLDGDRHLYEQLEICDCIHIQYETSFFLKNRSDHYFSILKRTKKPIVVSLHEVYEQFPGVFSRDKIRDGTILSPIKKWLYDYRHPYQTAYRQHLQAGFGASRLLVHHRFQKAILENRLPPSCPVIVQPMPVYQDSRVLQSTKTDTLSLGTTGFINPEYDYNLLFDTLTTLKSNWKFTWIGGIRTTEHQNLLDNIHKEIQSRNWTERFSITGWVSEETQSTHLSNIDIHLALFKNRSSSASIARALGARKLIIATENQIVSEINDSLGTDVIKVVKPASFEVAEAIEIMSTNKNEISRYYQSIDQYVAKYNFTTMASSMFDIYRTL
jgi:hypothetical protein